MSAITMGVRAMARRGLQAERGIMRTPSRVRGQEMGSGTWQGMADLGARPMGSLSDMVGNPRIGSLPTPVTVTGSPDRSPMGKSMGMSLLGMAGLGAGMGAVSAGMSGGSMGQGALWGGLLGMGGGAMGGAGRMGGMMASKGGMVGTVGATMSRYSKPIGAISGGLAGGTLFSGRRDQATNTFNSNRGNRMSSGRF
jgi:hypothetical protein